METPDQLIPLRDLARELRVDRSHFRRYVARLGIVPKRRHTGDSGNKLVVTITAEEAERVRQARRNQGYVFGNCDVDGSVGVFYVIQLVPELDPKRVKLGFADDVAIRLAQHRTAAPTARIVKTWACRRSWEFTAIDALASDGCRLILNEVYECSDLDRLLLHGDRFFELLPNPKKRPELSSVSPNNNDLRRELERRANDDDTNPSDTVPWEQVKTEALTRWSR
jgi:hypothetical protein